MLASSRIENYSHVQPLLDAPRKLGLGQHQSYLGEQGAICASAVIMVFLK